MSNQEEYATKGTPYYVRMKQGSQTLIGLTEQDYVMLLTRGFKDEEVYLSLRRDPAIAPEYDIEIRASLNTIKMEGNHLFQLCIDAEPTEELKERGFVEGREADLLIRMSPYRIPARQLNPEDVALDVFDETDPILDDPDVWLS